MGSLDRKANSRGEWVSSIMKSSYESYRWFERLLWEGKINIIKFEGWDTRHFMSRFKRFQNSRSMKENKIHFKCYLLIWKLTVTSTRESAWTFRQFLWIYYTYWQYTTFYNFTSIVPRHGYFRYIGTAWSKFKNAYWNQDIFITNIHAVRSHNHFLWSIFLQ